MVSKNDITKERKKELLKRAKDLGETMKIVWKLPEEAAIRVIEQKWGIHVAFDIDSREDPMYLDLGMHINYDISDECLGALEFFYAQALLAGG